MDFCRQGDLRVRRTDGLPVLPLHAQHLAQQHDRCQQIVVMDEPPLAEVVAGVERPVAVAATILAPPGGALDLADRAHGIEGFAGDGAQMKRTCSVSSLVMPYSYRQASIDCRGCHSAATTDWS